VVTYASQLIVEQPVERQAAGAGEAVSPGIDLAVLQRGRLILRERGAWRASDCPGQRRPCWSTTIPRGLGALDHQGIVSRIEFTAYGDGVSGVGCNRRHDQRATAADRPDQQQDGRAHLQQLSGPCTSYIIPSEEVDLFLKDVADGTYDGKPTGTSRSRP
jgi:hypothetical protein